jgi:hypothetical protein
MENVSCSRIVIPQAISLKKRTFEMAGLDFDEAAHIHVTLVATSSPRLLSTHGGFNHSEETSHFRTVTTSAASARPSKRPRLLPDSFTGRSSLLLRITNNKVIPIVRGKGTRKVVLDSHRMLTVERTFTDDEDEDEEEEGGNDARY